MSKAMLKDINGLLKDINFSLDNFNLGVLNEESELSLKESLTKWIDEGETSNLESGEFITEKRIRIFIKVKITSNSDVDAFINLDAYILSEDKESIHIFNFLKVIEKEM